MSPFIKTKKGIVDTNIKNNPHTECFHIKEGMLYIEDTYGNVYPYSEIEEDTEHSPVKECN